MEHEGDGLPDKDPAATTDDSPGAETECRPYEPPRLVRVSRFGASTKGGGGTIFGDDGQTSARYYS